MSAATEVVPLDPTQRVLPTSLWEVRAAGVTPDADPGQLDRIEAKIDAILAGADALRVATEPLLGMAAGPGGMLGMLGNLMRG